MSLPALTHLNGEKVEWGDPWGDVAEPVDQVTAEDEVMVPWAWTGTDKCRQRVSELDEARGTAQRDDETNMDKQNERNARLGAK